MKRFSVVFTIVSTLVIGVWLLLPLFVIGQIHKRHPEVGFESMELGWGLVFLHNVQIDKGWITAKAKLATINVRTEAVRLESGTIDADLDKKPPTTGAKDEQSNISADDFGVTFKSATHNLTVSALHVHVDSQAITSESARVSYKGYTVDLNKAVATRNLMRGVVNEVLLPEGLPYGQHVLKPVLTQVEFDRDSQTVTVKHATCDVDLGVSVSMDDLLMQKVDAMTAGVKIGQLGIAHPWLSSSGSVHFQHVMFEASPRILEEPFDVKLDGATLHIDPVTLGVKGDETCQVWADALPPEFHVGPLSSVKFLAGSLAFAFSLKPKPAFNIKGSCVSSCETVTEPRHKFAYLTYDKTGEQNAERRTTGPDVKEDWVPLSQVNATMPIAVRNMEDFGFYGHHGFIPEALEQSFIADVTSGKLQRGGSTITMQTAKNLWLSRDKTFGRKVEELFLSQVLESCFTKDEIMELYLNIIEFGPNVYGLRQAAAHYFKSEPARLDPREAFYLAWILPRPRKAPAPNADVMLRMSRLMQILSQQGGRIPEAMMLSVEPADTTGWEQAP